MLPHLRWNLVRELRAVVEEIAWANADPLRRLDDTYGEASVSRRADDFDELSIKPRLGSQLTELNPQARELKLENARRHLLCRLHGRWHEWGYARGQRWRQRERMR